jgi:hypothetical protein
MKYISWWKKLVTLALHGTKNNEGFPRNLAKSYIIQSPWILHSNLSEIQMRVVSTLPFA